MSYFALVKRNQVVKVTAMSEDIASKKKLPAGTALIQTSYNTRGGVHYDPRTGKPSADQSKALRKNYAGVGFTYDQARDAFIPPKPYPSWKLNEKTCVWEAPVAMPKDKKMYDWNETTKKWEVNNG